MAALTSEADNGCISDYQQNFSNDTDLQKYELAYIELSITGVRAEHLSGKKIDDICLIDHTPLP